MKSYLPEYFSVRIWYNYPHHIFSGRFYLHSIDNPVFLDDPIERMINHFLKHLSKNYFSHGISFLFCHPFNGSPDFYHRFCISLCHCGRFSSCYSSHFCFDDFLLDNHSPHIHLILLNYHKLFVDMDSHVGDYHSDEHFHCILMNTNDHYSLNNYHSCCPNSYPNCNHYI